MSSRLKSLERRNVAFAVLSVALLLVLVLSPARTSGVNEESLEKVFPGFKADQARVIKLYQAGPSDNEPASELVLTMKPNGQWVVSTQSGYPIVTGREERLLSGLETMRIRKLITTRQETFEEYAGPSGWLDIEVLAAGGKELAKLSLGNTARYPDLFTRVGEGEDARILQTINITRDMAAVQVDRWVEPRLFKTVLGEDVIRVEIEQPAFSRKAVLARKGESKKHVGATVPAKDEGDDAETWVLLEPKITDAHSDKVQDLVRSFSGLRFARIAAANVTQATEATFGFDEPDAIVRVRQRNVRDEVTNFRLVVGAKTEDGKMQYVQVDGLPWVYEVAPYQLADFRRDTEAYEVKPPEAPAPDDGDGDKEAAGSPDGMAAGSPDGDVGPGPIEPPAIETFQVVLKATGENEVELLKALRAATGLGLAEVKALTEGLPKTIKSGLTQAEADEMAASLKAVGADVEVKQDG
ncbi:MAG: ribosomal protein L7/L12 [Planctomycetota bacterium]|nr:ribosomal protein L7/L12 [Planctomycetota bacterium]